MPSAKRYDHDVFISYATVDDRPAKCGWVSAFVRNLEEILAASFGLRDSDRIWWDRSNIDEEASLTEQIRTKVQKSACMVVILSQGYVKSQWCRQEREAFLAAVDGQPDADRRLFLIDIGNLDQQDRPNSVTNGVVTSLSSLRTRPTPRTVSRLAFQLRTLKTKITSNSLRGWINWRKIFTSE